MRLIDADLAMKIADTDLDDERAGVVQYVLLHTPTINPEDLRKKGKWIGIEYDGYADGNPVYDLWECSNCGNEEKGEDVPEQNPFCRCCGAKMEG